MAATLVGVPPVVAAKLAEAAGPAATPAEVPAVAPPQAAWLQA